MQQRLSLAFGAILVLVAAARAQQPKPSATPAAPPKPPAAGGKPAAPPTFDERLLIHELGPNILAGAPPEEADIAALAKDKNVKRIINLAEPAEVPAYEAKACEAAGVAFVNAPVQTPSKTQIESHLSKEAVEKVLEMLAAGGDGVTYVHCANGAVRPGGTGYPRTGAIDIAYRVLARKEGYAPAVKDAITYGYFAVDRPNFPTDLKLMISGLTELPSITGTPIPDADLNAAGEMVEVGGQRLNVKKKGEGPPVYVLHGGPGETHRLYRPYLDDLAKDHTLVYYDQRGCGKSSKPQFEEAYTIERLSKELDGLREALKHDKISIIAHSSGVAIAAKYALTYKDHVDKLVLASGWASGKDFEKYGRMQPNLLSGLEYDVYNKMISHLIRENRRTFNDKEIMEISACLYPLDFFGVMTPEFRKDWNRRAECSSLVNHALNDEIFNTLDLTPELPKLQGIPTLVIAGWYDVVVPPETVKAYADGIPGSKYVVFKHSGHYHYVEENELWLKVVRAFLAGEELPAQ